MPERNAVKILITVVAVAATLQLAATPFFGDDLAYMGVFSGPNAHCDSFFDWLLNGARHWLNVNGRLANILFTALLLLPKWLLACICGCFTALMYSETIKLSGLSKNFTSAAILAGVMLLTANLITFSPAECAFGLSARYMPSRKANFIWLFSPLSASPAE